jgi:hypothetical protein
MWLTCQMGVKIPDPITIHNDDDDSNGDGVEEQQQQHRVLYTL